MLYVDVGSDSYETSSNKRRADPQLILTFEVYLPIAFSVCIAPRTRSMKRKPHGVACAPLWFRSG